MNTKITKQEMAGEPVKDFGRYMADAPNPKYYAGLMGRSFHSAELADRVARELSRDDLIVQMEYIPADNAGEEQWLR
jgi:hypothetical protein